jgi:hypothetical protein
VIILIDQSDEKPIFVHKKIVFSEVPKINSFVKVIKPGEVEGFSSSLPMNMKSALNAILDEVFPTPPKEAQPGPKESNGHTSVSPLIRGRIELWIWPKPQPKNSCVNVMRWVYLRQLTPDTSIKDFDSFASILAELGQWHHLHEHAMRLQACIQSSKVSAELLDANGRYFKKYLRDSILQKLKSQTVSAVEDMLSSIDSSSDRSGIVKETSDWFHKALHPQDN